MFDEQFVIGLYSSCCSGTSKAVRSIIFVNYATNVKVFFINVFVRDNSKCRKQLVTWSQTGVCRHR